MDEILGIPILGDLLQFGFNIVINLKNMGQNTSAKDYIRLAAIVGGYMLLRPYIIKLGAKAQGLEHEKIIEFTENAPKAKMSANALRGHNGKAVAIPEDSEEEAEEEGVASSVQWGKKATKRQRAHNKKLLEEAEEQLRIDQMRDEDKEIEEYLFDDGKEHLVAGKPIMDHLNDFEDGW